MGGNYQRDLYKQLMEVMSKVDSLESVTSSKVKTAFFAMIMNG